MKPVVSEVIIPFSVFFIKNIHCHYLSGYLIGNILFVSYNIVCMGANLKQYVLISLIKSNGRPPFDLASSKCSQFCHMVLL